MTIHCRSKVGPIAKLDGHTCRCTQGLLHPLPHTCRCGSWFEPRRGHGAAKRIANGAVLLGLVLLVLVLSWAWLVPPAEGTTPGTPPEDLTSCIVALDRLDAQTFDIVTQLDDTTARLNLVEGDRDRLDDEVTRLNRQVDRQARTIARLRERLAR